MEFANNTPHSVDVIYGGEKVFSVPTSGVIYRLTEEVTQTGVNPQCGATHTVKLGKVDPPLPPVKHGVTHIVSMPLLMGMMAAGISRPDFVYPYPMVRDENGRIVGCGGFATLD